MGKTLWYSLVSPGRPSETKLDRKMKEGTGLRTHTHHTTRITISATAIMNCELLACAWWLPIRTTKYSNDCCQVSHPVNKEEKKRKKKMKKNFMIHSLSRIDGNSLSSNVFPTHFALEFTYFLFF